FLCSLARRPPPPALFPYTTLFRSFADPKERSIPAHAGETTQTTTTPSPRQVDPRARGGDSPTFTDRVVLEGRSPRTRGRLPMMLDRKSTRLNSSHVKISYAVFCLK